MNIGLWGLCTKPMSLFPLSKNSVGSAYHASSGMSESIHANCNAATHSLDHFEHSGFNRKLDIHDTGSGLESLWSHGVNSSNGCPAHTTHDDHVSKSSHHVHTKNDTPSCRPANDADTALESLWSHGVNSSHGCPVHHADAGTSQCNTSNTKSDERNRNANRRTSLVRRKAMQTRCTQERTSTRRKSNQRSATSTQHEETLGRPTVCKFKGSDQVRVTGLGSPTQLPPLWTSANSEGQ